MSYGRHAAVSVALASRWGLRVHRLRWWIVAIWLLAVALGVPALSHISENLTAGGFEVPGSQSEQVKQIKQTELSGEFVRTDVLVLRSDSLTAGTPGYHAAVRDARAALLAQAGRGRSAGRMACAASRGAALAVARGAARLRH